MGIWFGDPGYSVGPFQQPAQPGIIDRLLKGVDVAMKLGDYYQNWQTKNQAQETSKVKGAAATIDLARAINPDQPVSLSGDLGKKIEDATGVTLPRVTPETQTGMASRVLAQIPPTIGEAGPVEGSRMTRLSSPELTQRQDLATKGMAAIPAVGEYAPLMPTMNEAKLKQTLLTGMTPQQQREALFPKTIPNITTVKGLNGETYQVSGRFAQEKQPGETSKEKTDRQIAVKQETGGRPTSTGKSNNLTPVMAKEQMYQQWVRQPGNEGKTRVDMVTAIEQARQAGKPDPTAIQTRTTTEGDNPLFPTKITKKEKAGTTPKPAGTQYVHTSDHPLTPEEAAAILKKLGK